MIEKFMNIMRLQSSLGSGTGNQTLIGQVIAYDPVAYAAQVKLYEGDPTDEDAPSLTTGWLPIGKLAIGVYAAPNIGDLVQVNFQEGNINNGIINLAINTGTPSRAVPAGTIFIESTNPVNLVAPVVNIDSPEVSLGNLDDALSGLLNGMAQSIYNSHTHNDPVSGVTGAPNEQMNSDTLTTSVRGN